MLVQQYFEFRCKAGEIITPDSWVFPRGYASTMPLRSCDVSVRFSHSFRNRIDLGSFRDGNFQRLICFIDGIVAKPPPTKMELSDYPDGWKYWLDHIRGY